jgi:hypothetical protein
LSPQDACQCKGEPLPPPFAMSIPRCWHAARQTITLYALEKRRNFEDKKSYVEPARIRITDIE